MQPNNGNQITINFYSGDASRGVRVVGASARRWCNPRKKRSEMSDRLTPMRPPVVGPHPVISMTGNNTTNLLRFEAQPPPPVAVRRPSASRPRNYFVPSCRPIQRVDLLGQAAGHVSEGPLFSGSGEGQTGFVLHAISGS